MSSQKNKIAIIGTVGLPANYGGFETLAAHLVKNLGDKYDMTVYCSGKRYNKQQQQSHYLGAKLRYIPLDANGIQSIPYDTLSIIHALFFADVLLILGVSGAWILPFVKLFTNKKIIISIDGIEWKRNKWSTAAKWYLSWAEKIAVKYSHIDISDNESIQDYTAIRYGSLSRIIEYGADHTLHLPLNKNIKSKYPFLMLPYAFKVCRIEPENNVHLVLEAFSNMVKHRLVIVGNWANSEYGIKLKSQYNQYANIYLLDPIYDQETLDMMRGNALLYLHGHSAGGTNPSLVEAMYLGLPVFSYKVSYNKTTTEGNAKYFTTVADLQELIENTDIVALKQLGSDMKAIADRRYVWKVIANKYDYLIQEALTVNGKNAIISEVSNINLNYLMNNNLVHLRHQQLFYEKR